MTLHFYFLDRPTVPSVANSPKQKEGTAAEAKKVEAQSTPCNILIVIQCHYAYWTKILKEYLSSQ